MRRCIGPARARTRPGRTAPLPARRGPHRRWWLVQTAHCCLRRGRLQTTIKENVSYGHDLSDLLQWLRLNGTIGIENVRCFEQPLGERGLVAASPFTKETCIFSLPLECAVCDWPGGETDPSLPILKDVPSSVRLAVKLMRLFQETGLPIPGGDADPDTLGAPRLDPLKPPRLAPVIPQTHPTPPGQRLPDQQRELTFGLQPRSLPSTSAGVPPAAAAEEETQSYLRESVLPQALLRGVAAPTASTAGTAVATAATAVGWGPYLRCLPTRPPAMLLTLSDPEDIAWLEYPALERALTSYRALTAHHYELCGGAGGLGGASLEQFTWALAIVGSRSLAASMMLLVLLAGRTCPGPGGGQGLGEPQPQPSHSSGSTSSRQRLDEVARRSEHGSLSAVPTAPASLPATVAAAGGGDGASRGACSGEGRAITDQPPASASASAPASTPLSLMAMFQLMRGLDWVPEDTPEGRAAGLGNAGDPSDGIRLSGNNSNNSSSSSANSSGNSSSSRAGSGSDESAHGRGAACGPTVGSLPCRGGGDGATVAGASHSSGTAITGGQLRMLVPLLDLINHGGDRRRPVGSPAGAVVSHQLDRLTSKSNVRWELWPPSRCGDGNASSAGGGGSAAGVTGDGGDGRGTSGGQEVQLPQPADPLCGFTRADMTPAGAGGGDGDGVEGGSGRSSGGVCGWRIALVASSDLVEGDELLLCYDPAATNDHFALHYGFVPYDNLYDDVQLYESLAEALAWHRAEIAAERAVTLYNHPSPCTTDDELDAQYAAAAAAAGAAAASEAADADELGAPVKLGVGGRVCGQLVAAFRHLPPLAPYAGSAAATSPIPGSHPGLSPAPSPALSIPPGCNPDPGGRGGKEEGPGVAQEWEPVSTAVARRCVQLLQSRTPLLADLEALLLLWDEAQRQRLQALQQQQRRQRRIQSTTQPAGAVLTCRCPGRGVATFRVEAGRQGGAAGPTDAPGSCRPGDLTERIAHSTDERGVEAAATACYWRELLQHYEAALADQPPELQALAGLRPPATPARSAAMAATAASTAADDNDGDISDNGCRSKAAEPSTVGAGAPPPAPAAMPPPIAAAAAVVMPAQGGSGGGGVGGGRGGGGGGGGGGGAERAPGAPQTALTPPKRLALEYRVRKKMLLWDFLLAEQSGPPKALPTVGPKI